MAATNKSLARNSKSRTGTGATKKQRSPTGPLLMAAQAAASDGDPRLANRMIERNLGSAYVWRPGWKQIGAWDEAMKAMLLAITTLVMMGAANAADIKVKHHAFERDGSGPWTVDIVGEMIKNSVKQSIRSYLSQSRLCWKVRAVISLQDLISVNRFAGMDLTLLQETNACLSAD
jgi:hypothetical protein